MVNTESGSPKNRILNLLRDSEKPISGEQIGKKLGISRVAVHKHIRILKNAGYRLEADYRGYRLPDSPGTPFSSWEFSPGENISVIDVTASTMDEAHRRAAAHPGEDFVLAARVQTGGRGRRERPWSSPAGGLWVTRVIHPMSSTLGISRFALAATAALAGLLRDEYGISAAVKWPNDVLVEGRKIAGVLVEGRFSGDRLDYLAIGLGLNVNNETADGAAALNELLGRDEDRRRILRLWILRCDRIFETRGFRNGKKTRWWKELMAGVGTQAAFRLSKKRSGRRIRGRIIGTDSLGRLVLRKENGRKVRLAAGDIEETI